MEALPAMGTLYAMYPVLVDTVICGDLHPYFSSGWCSSEFYTALLAQKLDRFSSEAVDDFSVWLAQGAVDSAVETPMMSQSTLEALKGGVLDDSHVKEFTKIFEIDL